MRPEMPASGGSDVLVGGAGDDLLVGGAGRDLLIGGYAARHGAPTSQQDVTFADGLPGPNQATWDAPEETSSPGDGQ
jgi:Ca2+-binding RTX toxin-like protein